jgi:transposase
VARDRPVGERTALTNRLRAYLVERGLIMPQGRRTLELYLETLLATAESSIQSVSRFGGERQPVSSARSLRSCLRCLARRS